MQLSENLKTTRRKSKKPGPGNNVMLLPPQHTYIPQFTINDLLETLGSSRWLILVILLFSLLAGVAHLYFAQPIYRADALIQVENRRPLVPSLHEMSRILFEEPVASEQIDLIKSRMVLRQVIDALRLDIVAQPVYFPLIGAAIARKWSPVDGDSIRLPASVEQIADRWEGLRKYAWDGERIAITQLEVPDAYLNKPFVLVAKAERGYELFSPDGTQHLATGKVGEPLRGSISGGEPFELTVSELIGEPGGQYTVMKMPTREAIEQLEGNLAVTETGSTSSNMLRIFLQGPDRHKAKIILDEIARTYTRQNTEYQLIEVDRNLSFLRKQSSVVKKQAQSAEQALANYYANKGPVNLSTESHILLEKLVAVEAQLSELNVKRQELQQRYTKYHPDYNREVEGMDAQIDVLRREQSALNTQVKNLPVAEQRALGLSRDAQVYETIYTSLLGKIQELQMLQVSPLGNVRIVDNADSPMTPIKPQSAPLLILYATLGTVLALSAAFLRRSLRPVVGDPEIINRKIGLPVYARVPHSTKQSRSTSLYFTKSSKRQPLLASIDPHDPAIESLRMLRTALHFVLLDAKNNVLLITGPTPDVGKSFVTANFAAVLCAQGRNVLIIDADLRKGRLNTYFDATHENGLSDLIVGDINISEAIHKTSYKNLDILPRGRTAPNPGELLLHERFSSVLEEVSTHYSYVLIDSPPVLAVSDATYIGALTGSALLVLKANKHSLREIEQSVQQLRQGRVKLRGVVFNNMRTTRSGYRYGKYYGYTHSYGPKG